MAILELLFWQVIFCPQIDSREGKRRKKRNARLLTEAVHVPGAATRLDRQPERPDRFHRRRQQGIPSVSPWTGLFFLSVLFSRLPSWLR